MTKTMIGLKFDTSGNYFIRAQGKLDESWSDRLGGMTISVSYPSGNHQPVTTLQGELMDQAELLGVLTTLYQLHLPLLTVEYQGVEQEDEMINQHTLVT